jgi:hypothetical protein
MQSRKDFEALVRDMDILAKDHAIQLEWYREKVAF